MRITTIIGLDLTIPRHSHPQMWSPQLPPAQINEKNRKMDRTSRATSDSYPQQRIQTSQLIVFTLPDIGGMKHTALTIRDSTISLECLTICLRQLAVTRSY